MCCQASPNVSTTGGMVKQMTSSTMARAPKGEMTLIEYLGKNVGSETWGGPGVTPSNSYYVFGDNDKDRQKYVRPEDVNYFLFQEDIDGSPLFGKADLAPATAEPVVKRIEVGGTVTPVGQFGGETPKPVKRVLKTGKSI